MATKRSSLCAVWVPDKALTRACTDFSDLEIGPDGRLYLRSDKSATIALIDDLTPEGGMLRLPAWRLCDLRASRKASRSATDVDRPAARVHFPDFVGMVGELSDCRRYPTRNRRRALYGQFRRRRPKSWQTRDECFAAAVSFSGVYLWDFVTRVTASGYSGLPQFRPCAPYAASSVHARHSVRESSQ